MNIFLFGFSTNFYLRISGHFFLNQSSFFIECLNIISLLPAGEQLCDAKDLEGLLDDGARLEKTGSLTQATVPGTFLMASCTRRNVNVPDATFTYHLIAWLLMCRIYRSANLHAYETGCVSESGLYKPGSL